MLKIHSAFAKISCVIALVSASGLLLADEYSQINLVSDISGLANTTDPNLLDPWGVSFSATSPFWVSNQASGTTTLYDGDGNKRSLTVSIPNLGGAPGSVNNGPAGQVFNIGGGTSFLLAGAGSGADFIFAKLDGSISGWNGGVGTTAKIEASTAGASYTGLAIATVNDETFTLRIRTAAKFTFSIRVGNKSASLPIRTCRPATLHLMSRPSGLSST